MTTRTAAARILWWGRARHAYSVLRQHLVSLAH